MMVDKSLKDFFNFLEVFYDLHFLQKQKLNIVMALQLSGKIPALGAGGPGSIPGEALFIIYNKVKVIEDEQKFKKKSNYKMQKASHEI